MSESIGVIGLGSMGGPIASRLMNAGFNCVVHDTTEARMQAFAAAGARTAQSPTEVADACEVVVCSLPSPEVSRNVALGEGGIVHGRSVTHVVETSTMGIVAAREIAAALADRGVVLVDAPISGGPVAIRNHTLTTMIAGPESALARVDGVVRAFSPFVIQVGGQPGEAQACKLVNNAMSLSILAIACEAAVFGVAAGLDPHVMIDVINRSSGRSAVTETKFLNHILKRRFDFGATLSLGEKDLRLFVEEARALGSPTELTPVAARVWAEAGDSDGRERDMMELIKWYERPLGVVVGAEEQRPPDGVEPEG